MLGKTPPLSDGLLRSVDQERGHHSYHALLPGAAETLIESFHKNSEIKNRLLTFPQLFDAPPYDNGKLDAKSQNKSHFEKKYAHSL
jgi:hypothetical protein